tara:strand:- start:1464 stop:2120 length:657 start_codon:yes stop_codon:yes gene_type:complete
MSSRERILNRLREGAEQQSVPAQRQPVNQVWAAPEESSWLDLFCQNMSDNHADVILTTEAQWMAELQRSLCTQGVSRLLCGDHAQGHALQKYLNENLPSLQADIYATAVAKPELFMQVDAGFSVASGALAETGSLVVSTGPQEPRTLSLVPPLNIVLVKQSQLRANFSAWVAEGMIPDVMPTNLLLISGPSKTADIQQTLAYGAHGPKSLIVLMLTDA